MAERREPGMRLRRLLAMVAWLAQRQTATLSELAERFGMNEREVEDELLLASMCGLPPYSPDQLIDFLIMDGVVEARVPDYFHRPRRLTATDALALVTAGRTLLAVPGADRAGPLASALDKLAAALGGGGDGVGVAVELDSPEHLEALRAAAADAAQVEITYYSEGRGVVGDRIVDPLRVFADGGHWYLEAYCHTTQRVLTFRADRVEEVTRTGEKIKAARRQKDLPARAGVVFHPGADTESVTISVPASGRWVADTYPVENVEELKGGRLRITLAVSGDAFLERLLLRLGPETKVLSPRSRKDAARAAALRVLARYA